MYWPRLAIVTGALLIGIQAGNRPPQEVARWITGTPYHGGINREHSETG
jgi:hypothetical protein